MHTVAIIGAGELGGALARTLATRDAVSRIVLVDEAGNVAAGKALDIRQTGPVESVRHRGRRHRRHPSGLRRRRRRDSRSAWPGGARRGGRAGPGRPCGQTVAGRAHRVCRRGRPRADDAGDQGTEVVDDAPDRVGAGGRRGCRVRAERASARRLAHGRRDPDPGSAARVGAGVGWRVRGGGAASRCRRTRRRVSNRRWRRTGRGPTAWPPRRPR